MNKVALLFVVLAVVCCATQPGKGLPVGEDPEKFFLDQALSHVFKEQIESGKPLFFNWETTLGLDGMESAIKATDSIRNDSKGMSCSIQEAISDFLDKNATNAPFRLGKHISLDYYVLKPERGPLLQAPLVERPNGKEMGEIEFREKYRYQPVISLSVPGFSKDRTVGIIFIERYVGPLKWSGRIVIFEFVEGTWQETDLEIGWAWISEIK